MKYVYYISKHLENHSLGQAAGWALRETTWQKKHDLRVWQEKQYPYAQNYRR